MQSLAVCAALMARLLFAPAPVETLVDRIVARVNDSVLTLSDVDREIAPTVAKLMKEQTQEQVQAALPQLRHDALQYLVDRKVMADAVRTTLAESQQQSLDKLVEERQRDMMRLAGSRATFRTQLLKRGMTMEEHLEFLKTTVLFEEAKRRIAPSPSTLPSPAEIRDYYLEHAPDFLQSGWVTIRQIVVRFANHTEPEARGIIDAAALRLSTGENFPSVAKAVSEGPGAAEGGLWERVAKGALMPELDEAAFKIPIGIPSDVTKTSVGYHILLVEQRQEERSAPLTEVYGEIQKMVRQQRAGARLNDWVRLLEKSAYVEAVGGQPS